MAGASQEWVVPKRRRLGKYWRSRPPVFSTVPRAGSTWGAEADGRVETRFERFGAVELAAVVVGDRRDVEGLERRGGGVGDGDECDAVEPAQHGVARGAFVHDEDRGTWPFGKHEVAFPVADLPSLFDVGRSLSGWSDAVSVASARSGSCAAGGSRTLHGAAHSEACRTDERRGSRADRWSRGSAVRRARRSRPQICSGLQPRCSLVSTSSRSSPRILRDAAPLSMRRCSVRRCASLARYRCCPSTVVLLRRSSREMVLASTRSTAAATEGRQSLAKSASSRYRCSSRVSW